MKPVLFQFLILSAENKPVVPRLFNLSVASLKGICNLVWFKPLSLCYASRIYLYLSLLYDDGKVVKRTWCG